jgi:sirohydrochlorin ferrochelatase
MKIPLNNPASRLVILLFDIQRASGGAVAETFYAALKVPKGDVVEMVAQQQAWHKTVDDVTKRLASSGNGHLAEVYEEQTARKLRLLLAPTNFSIPWNNFKAEFFRDDLVSNMLIYSTVLSNSAPEKELTEDELASLTRELTAVYDAVRDSSIEATLKDLILDGLEDLRRAIHDYRIRGIAGIDAAVSRNALAAAVVHERPESVLKKYSEFIKTAAAHATLYAHLSVALPALPELVKRISNSVS